MLNKRQAGMTLIELIIAIMILSIGVGGVLVVYKTTSRTSVDPVIQKQALAIAEGMMEEIQRMPFAINGIPPVTGCARNTYDDVRDYNGYSTTDACDVLGNVRAPKYAVAVTVVLGANPNFPNVAANNLLQITVTVTSGTYSVSVVGWRTNYAQFL
jgi:MSHA pilin protein MshD